jgi:hypothetical protein
MPSTFTTNYGFEEIATGEQSGTWGTTTNFNFDILDRITAYKAVALSDASTATLTVREASPGSGTENLQDGMYRVIKFTGALSQNCTVTIAPNTTSAYFIFINATTDSGSSGPYTTIISQGSGANYTVANGTSALVYCDGAGSGAVVTAALVESLTTRGDIVVRNASNVTSRLAVGSANYVLKTDGTDVSWGQVSLTAGVTGTLPIANGGTNSTSTTYCALGSNVSGTLPVANGGTGATTHTANGVLIGEGTSAMTTVAPSTSGNVLTSDGTDWTSASADALDGTPGTDHTANGPQTNTFDSGYSSTIMDLVYMGSGGKWLEADADATGTSINMLAVALEAKTDTQAMNVALPGSFVRDDTWNWTIGVPLYVSTTLGAITATAPSGSGDVVRTVGFAVTADIIYFNPSPDYLTVA